MMDKQMAEKAERFQVLYSISGTEQEAYAKARDICLEQTVEFPDELVPEGIIRDEIVGRIESFEVMGNRNSDVYLARISYTPETSAYELTQLMNVIFGNTSIKPGIRVEELALPGSLLSHFKGPRFGRKGLRDLLGVPKRPLLATALKPMGLSSEELARLAYQCALGGIDIVKDDHGLTNQPYSPFEERLKLCSEAVRRANRETGGKSVYVPNVTAPIDRMWKRASMARDEGAGGMLIAPGLAGLDTMRWLADDDSIGLPIISHPAFMGSYVTCGSGGIGHYVSFGQLIRLAGADATIYPNFGGRFSFSEGECERIAQGTSVPMGSIKAIFPSPGGGMSLQSIPESISVYGNEVIFLVGGGLFKHSPDLVENARYFRKLVDLYE